MSLSLEPYQITPSILYHKLLRMIYFPICPWSCQHGRIVVNLPHFAIIMSNFFTSYPKTCRNISFLLTKKLLEMKNYCSSSSYYGMKMKNSSCYKWSASTFCSHHSPHKVWWRMHKTAKKRCWTMFFNRLETDMTFKNNLSKKINGAIKEKGALDVEWCSHVALNVFLPLRYIWNIVPLSSGFL